MKTESFFSFRQRIHKSAVKIGYPLRVMFELTYRCNFKCPHCYVPQSYKNEKRRELTTQEIFFILEQLREAGCLYLGFTGGEPFLREDIVEIIRFAKRCGFQIFIYSNGSLIDEKIAIKLKRLRPIKIDMTIPALSKVPFERISGVPGSRNQVFNSIRFLHENGIHLGFRSNVVKENEAEIEKIQRFSDSLGIPYRLNYFLWPCLDGSKKPYLHPGTQINKAHTPSLDSRENDLRYCLPDSLLPEAGGQSNPETSLSTLMNQKTGAHSLFPCGVGLMQAAITPFGELKMCVMIDYPKYKIQDSSFKDAWERLKALVRNIKPDENYQCDTCELKTYCNRCPAMSWIKNGNFTSCVLENPHQAAIDYNRNKAYGNGLLKKANSISD
jgi:radical SAM protein with 4Fe4S-binding SPASM domain